MKLKFLFSFLLLASQLSAQKLNHAGHLISDDAEINYEVHYDRNGSNVLVDDLKLRGNGAFKTANGIVTLEGEDDSKISTLRLYNREGKETFRYAASQIINFSMSPGGSVCAFHDSKEIHLLNLITQTSRTFKGSNVFAINQAGELAYFDESDLTIHFNGHVIKTNELVYRILFFKEQLIFITMKNVMVMEDKPEIIFNVDDGRVFDAGVFDNKLFLSTKKKHQRTFIFNSFSSFNLEHFVPEEEIHYPLSENQKNTPLIKNEGNFSSTIQHEPIQNPINFYQDTVYQEVGNSYDEIQEYQQGSPYLHEGIDLLGVYFQDVHSVKHGYVKAILTTNAEYHWRIAISNENTSAESQGYMYAHLEETAIPYAVGDSVEEGDVIGQLVDFPVTGFVHCHFARVLCQGNFWNGDWWTFDNPLSYMTNFFDSIAPEFEKTINNDAFAFRNSGGSYLSPDSLYGSVQVISKVHDRINSSWKVDVHSLKYNLSPLSSPQTLLVDTHSYTYNFFDDGYFSGTYQAVVMNTIYSRDGFCFSTADYQVRDFYHVVTNSDGDDTITSSDALQLFNTAAFPDGSYIFRVIASDPSGNTTTDSMIIEFKNGINGIQDFSSAPSIYFSPNPVSSFTTLNSSRALSNATLTIYDPLGRKADEFQNLTGNNIVIRTETLSEGFYFFKVEEGNRVLFFEKILIAE